MKKIVLGAFVLLLSVVSCKKSDGFDAAKQSQLDEELILAFMQKNNITAKRHDSGMYYIISNPGSGSFNYYLSTRISAKYTGRLLNGAVFDSNVLPLSQGVLGELDILGWQIGIPFIQPGGRIRLLIPSQLAYGRQAIGNIPANSVLDFDIELLNVLN